jgi:large conductance mechanosensitive channel
MAGGFKQFLLRGNVVDMAVGVVIGAAFGGVVTGFTKDLLTPMIAAVAGKPDFSAIKFTVNGSAFLLGDFINDYCGGRLLHGGTARERAGVAGS